MKQRLKDFAISAMRVVLKVLYVFPIKKNRILLMSYGGRAIAGSPKCIYEYLNKTYPQRFEFIWVLNEVGECNASLYNARVISHKSFAFYFYTLTARLIVSNSGFHRFMPLRKAQKYVDTTHGGGAYKRCETIIKTKYEEKRLHLTKKPDCLTSSCKVQSGIVKRTDCLDDSMILECGLPRNDVFFNSKERGEQSEKVRDIFALHGKRILLVAPTYRGDFLNPQNSSDMDFSAIKDALKARFGEEWRILYRAHYSIADKALHDNCIDASRYDDMQDLLCAADVLITDYSSSIWDYSFTGRPCFLYTPDLKDYKTERDFYTPIEEWPFPVATSNEQLCDNIKNYNEAAYMVKVKVHHNALGSFETGHATEAVCKRICDMWFSE